MLDIFKHNEFHTLTEPRLTKANTLQLDLSENNPELSMNDVQDADSLQKWLDNQLKKHNKEYAIGGYLEERLVYKRSNHFDNADGESRTVHLGVDLWGPERWPIYAPMAGRVHSFQENNNYGDYGPTIILEHQLNNQTFYTLYGHLSRDSIMGIEKKQEVAKGQHIALLGNPVENGNWPPHLHFQLIMDMEGREGDFPGVAAPSELGKYKRLCPDPNLIVQFE